MRRDIGPIPIIFVTIVTPVEVVVAVVVSISDIMTLTVIVTIDLTFVSLTLAPILLILSLGHSVGNLRSVHLPHRNSPHNSNHHVVVWWFR